MKNILIFILGFVAGIFVTIFFVFLIGLGIKANNKNEEKKVVQKIEVKGKKGRVMLYVGIPKDSVELLVGKPDEVRLDNLGDMTIEDWGYKLKNEYISDLDISFNDGRMTSVDQK
ncbi:MAG: hypothetical protein E6R13_03220 [Spirochaetes bacterium]|nr:MAG: hypothetical protein E6R13_03220 [Spirochaetota bacterium]